MKNNNKIYFRKHITLREEIYKEFIIKKAETMQKTRENFSDSSFVEFLLKNFNMER